MSVANARVLCSVAFVQDVHAFLSCRHGRRRVNVHVAHRAGERLLVCAISAVAKWRKQHTPTSKRGRVQLDLDQAS